MKSNMYVLDGKEVRPAVDVAEYVDEMGVGPKLLAFTDDEGFWYIETMFTGTPEDGFFRTLIWSEEDGTGGLEYTNTYEEAMKMHWTKVSEFSTLQSYWGRFMAYFNGED